MTDYELIELWLHGKADRTIEGYRCDIRQFSDQIRQPLAEITLSDLQRFSKSLSDRKLKDATIGRKIKALKSLLAFAAKQGHIAFDVGAAMTLPKTSTNLAGRILTCDQVESLFAAAETESHRLFFMTSYYLALRIGEAVNLKWTDFNAQGKGRIQVAIKGKGGKLQSIAVPETLWQMLQPLRGEDLRLFPIHKRTAHDIVKRSVKSADLPSEVSHHWLRHAHARHAIEAGAPIHVVRDTLRHSSIAVTNAYLESFPDQSSADYLSIGNS